MKIIPALDLLDGKCVRLFQGRYDKQKVYDRPALEVLREYQQKGAERLHLIDLQGAKDPMDRQWSLVKTLVSEINLPIQMGGGVRNIEDALELYKSGVAQVIIGSMAVKDPESTQQLLNHYPQTILGADLISAYGGKYIATDGWTENSRLSFSKYLNSFENVQYVLCTDISRDGTMTEPNFQLYQDLQDEFPSVNFIASGGVSSLEDLKILKELKIYGVVIGKALLEGAFTLEEALKC